MDESPRNRIQRGFSSADTPVRATVLQICPSLVSDAVQRIVRWPGDCSDCVDLVLGVGNSAIQVVLHPSLVSSVELGVIVAGGEYSITHVVAYPDPAHLAGRTVPIVHDMERTGKALHPPLGPDDIRAMGLLRPITPLFHLPRRRAVLPLARDLQATDAGLDCGLAWALDLPFADPEDGGTTLTAAGSLPTKSREEGQAMTITRAVRRPTGQTSLKGVLGVVSELSHIVWFGEGDDDCFFTFSLRDAKTCATVTVWNALALRTHPLMRPGIAVDVAGWRVKRFEAAAQLSVNAPEGTVSLAAAHTAWPRGSEAARLAPPHPPLLTSALSRRVPDGTTVSVVGVVVHVGPVQREVMGRLEPSRPMEGEAEGVCAGITDALRGRGHVGARAGAPPAAAATSTGTDRLPFPGAHREADGGHAPPDRARRRTTATGAPRSARAVARPACSVVASRGRDLLPKPAAVARWVVLRDFTSSNFVFARIRTASQPSFFGRVRPGWVVHLSPMMLHAVRRLDGTVSSALFSTTTSRYSVLPRPAANEPAPEPTDHISRAATALATSVHEWVDTHAGDAAGPGGSRSRLPHALPHALPHSGAPSRLPAASTHEARLFSPGGASPVPVISLAEVGLLLGRIRRLQHVAVLCPCRVVDAAAVVAPSSFVPATGLVTPEELRSSNDGPARSTTPDPVPAPSELHVDPGLASAPAGAGAGAGAGRRRRRRPWDADEAGESASDSSDGTAVLGRRPTPIARGVRRARMGRRAPETTPERCLALLELAPRDEEGAGLGMLVAGVLDGLAPENARDSTSAAAAACRRTTVGAGRGFTDALADLVTAVSVRPWGSGNGGQVSSTSASTEGWRAEVGASTPSGVGKEAAVGVADRARAALRDHAPVVACLSLWRSDTAQVHVSVSGLF